MVMIYWCKCRGVDKVKWFVRIFLNLYDTVLHTRRLFLECTA